MSPKLRVKILMFERITADPDHNSHFTMHIAEYVMRSISISAASEPLREAVLPTQALASIMTTYEEIQIAMGHNCGPSSQRT